MAGIPLFKIESKDGASYDEANAFVVAAASEDQVRALLSALIDPEGDEEFGNARYAGDEGIYTWIDPTRLTCTMISEGSIYEEPTVVICDFHHG